MEMPHLIPALTSVHDGEDIPTCSNKRRKRKKEKRGPSHSCFSFLLGRLSSELGHGTLWVYLS